MTSLLYREDIIMSRQRDAELDRLKVVCESARQRQQAAWEAQQAAWERRSLARAVMNRAWEAKQAAYADQQAAWEAYMFIKLTNGPRIEILDNQQEKAYQEMKSAFESASLAYDMRDGGGARMYANQGHACKARSQTLAAERRQLVSEIRAARERFESAKPAFQAAKGEFARAQQTFHSARAEHELAEAEFKRAKTNLEECTKAFRSRLDELKSASRKKRKELAAKAGVPLRHQDDVWISTEPNGNVNIYFGGVDKPDGPGHGHYVMSQNGTVTYRRDPFAPHGAQNFTENRRESATLRMAQMAMDQWAKTQVTRRSVQYEDSDFKVAVRSGYDHRHDSIVTDVLIFDKHNKREHYHLIIDENGNELFSEWRPNR